METENKFKNKGEDDNSEGVEKSVSCLSVATVCFSGNLVIFDFFFIAYSDLVECCCYTYKVDAYNSWNYSQLQVNLFINMKIYLWIKIERNFYTTYNKTNK